MKKKTEELDVDFIGGQDQLTKEQEIAISDYFAKRREIKHKLVSKTSKKVKV